jgi:hypothetical protein
VCLVPELQWEVYNRRITVQAGLGKMRNPISKISRVSRLCWLMLVMLATWEAEMGEGIGIEV